MSVAAGRLNQRIRILQRLTTTDDFGQPSTSWLQIAHVWAAVKTRTGKGLLSDETILANRDTSRTPVVFEIRQRRGLNADMRIEYRNEVYEIRSIDPDEDRQEYLNITTAKGA